MKSSIKIGRFAFHGISGINLLSKKIMSLVRPVETSWERSNWKQVSVPDTSEIFTQISAGCALLYSIGSQGQTAQALGHLWLMAPDRAGFKQVALILTLWNYFCVHEHSVAY